MKPPCGGGELVVLCCPRGAACSAVPRPLLKLASLTCLSPGPVSSLDQTPIPLSPQKPAVRSSCSVSEKSRSPAHVACPLTCLVSLPHFVLGQRAVQARGRNQSQTIWFPFCSATRWVDYVSSMNFNFLTLIFKNII